MHRARAPHRLYLQIWLGFLGIVVLFALFSALLLWLVRDEGPSPDWRDDLVAAAESALPPRAAGPAVVQAALDALSGRFDVALMLVEADGRPLARSGRMPPPRGPIRPGWHRMRGGVQIVMPLADGRLLVAHHHGRFATWWPWLLLALVLAVGIGAHPLAKRITRRVERLQTAVEGLGAGDLAARVPVEGRDEVARLAASFNDAAARIEALVVSQRAMLANASHELRSPLARLRVAVELLAARADAGLAEDVRRDIAELDGLVDEILLLSRIEASAGLARREPLDLLALLAEEAARTGASVDGESVELQGDPVWLRRLVRNLLDNARRHGGGAAVRAGVGVDRDGRATLFVEDDGPGIPAAERERVFEPFYRRAGQHEGEGGGVGLGLALVRRIARRHGGDVTCVAAASGGSRFEVTLARG